MIRLSGIEVVDALEKRFETDADWTQTTASRRYPGAYRIENWRSPVPVDLWLWPTTRSYTGQPSAELHLVGSPPIVDAILEQLYRDGARPARAGEFTLRAFLAGRVDLAQAEAVLGVIDATDDTQLRAALAQLAGGLSHQVAEIRESLLLDLADLEAGLDFVEEDIEFVHREQMRDRIRRGLDWARELLQQSDTRMVSGSRPRVVLAGLPNAGKSTLFNCLVGESRAIVSELAGTTRDYLSALVEWEGVPLELVDTAGADTTSEGIAFLAEEMRVDQLDDSDLVIWCSAAAMKPPEQQIDELLYEQVQGRGIEIVRVGTQSDKAVQFEDGELLISARTGDGIERLKGIVCHRLASRAAHFGEWLATTAARSRDSLLRCVAGLDASLSACDQQLGDELLALELRSALEALGEICGQVQTDDLLDRIFSRFCIGK